MDARRGEYYNAIFESDGRELKRVCEDRAVPLDDLEHDLASNDRQITLVGDGAPSAFSGLKSKIPNIALAPPHLMHQSAIGVAFAASEAYQNKSQDSPHDLSSLNPVYIRRPQAERERLEREQAL
jgi:tRNA threonylcarbamoyladenosine biosynthesis protein TsaB